MTQRKYNDLFCHRSEIVGKKFGPADTVVLIDDFSGTGGQATTAWNEYFAELFADGPRVVLMLLCATSKAAERISEETEMQLHTGHILQDRDNLFSEACLHFSTAEKETAVAYCKRARSSEPKGYGDCGLLLVFSYKCPNNSIPVLHANARRWEPVFPRRGD
jgi:hypothetical protein